ncbi:katanin p60 ATPase-containing subunit A-like 2 isoform X2 [Chelonus insularis]|uniref:katanin p60 ATPase-containing subunit A-like 2 isoform X2 n=1 Tax=Chelonus insularis TaxID=460826 RepID=UPI00158B7962|nr:katanin p60 ATPase-containing subunit A-like 2 isoform X2 [Chelonus insularis]
MHSASGKQSEGLRRDLIYLIFDFLRQANLTETSKCLKKEAQLISDEQLCDNIDLEIILHHFIDYYVAKFNKMPRIRKNVANSVSQHYKCPRKHNSHSEVKCKSDSKVNKKSLVHTTHSISNFFTITPISQKHFVQLSKTEECNKTDHTKSEINLSLKGLYPDNSEFYDIAQIIIKEVILTNLNIYWADIYGLEECKRILQETILYPIKYPEIFNTKFTSWQGILLYGPPGTGKTMLAKAVATECKWTFFNVTASLLVSKWRGDSEKFIKILCELARHYSPSIIFIDEVDWTTGSDTNSEKNSEPMRRFRAELLTGFDGIISLDNNNVTLLAATNTPWNLDTALLRRFEKHILVDLPDECTRKQILKYYTASNLHELDEFDSLIKNTKYYSGSDLKRLCKEAWMNQTRIYIENMNKKNRSAHLSESNIHSINSIFFLEEALKILSPTTKHLMEKFYNWKNRKN